MTMDQKNAVTRRGFFRKAGVAGVAGVAMASGGFLGTPLRHAHAEEAPPTGEIEESAVDMDKLIAEHVGAGSITMEKITLDIPGTAENAALVRMPIVVDHPMTSDNFIQTVALFIDNNPSPFIAQIDLTPGSGKAAVEFRVRMAKPSRVRVIAKNNAGKLYGIVKKIQVAAGGCAG